MRSVLAEYKDKRLTFTGRFERFGVRHGSEKTVLIREVRDGNGDEVCDHIWLKGTREFEGLEPGDVVRFDARVIGYIKGYRGQKPGLYHKPIEIDYELSGPRKVRKLEGGHERE